MESILTTAEQLTHTSLRLSNEAKNSLSLLEANDTNEEPLTKNKKLAAKQTVKSYMCFKASMTNEPNRLNADEFLVVTKENIAFRANILIESTMQLAAINRYDTSGNRITVAFSEAEPEQCQPLSKVVTSLQEKHSSHNHQLRRHRATLH